MGVTTFSDEELIYSLKTGEKREEAIRFMYENYFKTLSGFVVGNKGSLEDAEDIFQEVIINFIALVNLNKFRGESSIRTFLYSLNRFTWLNEIKKRSKSVAREFGFEKEKDNMETDVSFHIIQKESTAKILNLIKDLGETCRKILLMFYYENLSMKEMLEQLNYGNEQVVRNKKYKCLKQLENVIRNNPSLSNALKNLFNE